MRQIRKIAIVATLFLAGISEGNAQNFQDNPYTAEINVGIGAVSNANLQLRRNFYMFGRGRFSVSPGIRLGYATAQSVDYISAPFDITSEPKNVDTFRIAGTAIITANISVNLSYQLTDKLSLGFDIDAFGISSGKDQTGTWIPGEASANTMAVPIANINSKPTGLNALLGGDNDLGTLASGFSLTYRVTDNIGVKAGLGYLFTEYTSDNSYGVSNNDRWRAKSVQFAFGANYNF